MSTRTRTCAVCGMKYDYCPTCEADRFKPTWMMTFHDNNCREIWDVLSAISCKTIDKTEGVERLEALDLSKKHNFVPNVRKYLDEVLGGSGKVEKTEKKSEKSKKYML